MTNRRNILVGCLLGLISAALVLALDATVLLERFENYTWDLRVRAMAPPAPDLPIKIIVLDQGSLDWGERNNLGWPWPRNMYGMLLSYCRRAQVKAIAFDVFFTEDYKPDPPSDAEFAAEVARTPQYIGALPTTELGGGSAKWSPHAPPSPFRVEGLDIWLTAHPDSEVPASRAMFAIPQIARGTRVSGHVRSPKDQTDEVIRRAYPIQVFDGQIVPSLGIAPFLVFGDGASGGPATMSMDGDTLVMGEKRIELDDRGRSVLFNYRPRDGVEHAFEAFPVASIIDSELQIMEGKKPALPPEVFKDCYVFFGFTAPGLFDLRATPFSKTTPGVELQVTLLANVMTGQMVAPAGRGGVLAFVLLWSMLCGVATARGGKAWWLAMIAAIAVAAPIVLGVVGYKALVWWPIMSPLMASTLSVTAGIVYIYTTEYRQRRYIHAAFGRYLSPKVVDRLVADPKLLDLGGIDKELSIFFSDMEHFSKISEELGARRVTILLNEVLSEISQVIRDEDGTLDKYVGDAVVAFWNAPTDQPDHAIRAVRAALRCQRRMKEREAEFRELSGGHTVRIRIGLHIGEVVVGNLGSKYLMNYSMMGDAANLASRLEGANKAFGTMILCSHELWSKTGDQFFGRQLGTVTVVGRDTPVQIIEPLGAVSDPLPAGLSRFARALALSHEGLIDEAIAVLQTLHDDAAAQAYVSYLRGLDPGMRWDGVWRLTAK